MTVTRADIAAFLSPLEHSEEILGLLMPALYAPAVTPTEVEDSTVLRLLKRACRPAGRYGDGFHHPRFPSWSAQGVSNVGGEDGQASPYPRV